MTLFEKLNKVIDYTCLAAMYVLPIVVILAACTVPTG